MFYSYYSLDTKNKPKVFLWMLAMLCLWLDSTILRVFSNQNDYDSILISCVRYGPTCRGRSLVPANLGWLMLLVFPPVLFWWILFSYCPQVYLLFVPEKLIGIILKIYILTFFFRTTSSLIFIQNLLHSNFTFNFFSVYQTSFICFNNLSQVCLLPFPCLPLTPKA